MKLIHITDLHLVRPGVELKRLNPEQRLRDCLADIEAHHLDAAAIVVSGDLTEHGDHESYVLLRNILDEYRLPPVYLTLGNHDERSAFSEVFPHSVDESTGYAQTHFNLGSHTGLLLDTSEPGEHAGILCSQRLIWLRQRLEADRRPALLFMHHAPFRVSLKRLDQIPLLSDGQLWATIKPFRDRICHLFFGHMHRNISGSWRGIPFTVAAGTTHQVMLNFETELVQHAIVEPSYTVALIDETNVVVHFNQVRQNWNVITQSPASTGAQLSDAFDLVV